ncbi:interleukin-22 receptor subunit alpha-2 isoform X2 [Lepisosteus oculatus]|uniref:interleukin-22 receptor subunit alpha-2 isoform X2 n=1 Tax=Lepisosteus oculatus TaxID=7918 RepID=UPI000740237D|nr:PREDICTED: interleukin-20 receptor subunit alpha-like isoform X3 [Lepisosteus oculatus]
MSRLPCSLIMLYLCGLLLSIGVWTSPCQETLTSKDFHTVLSWRCPELPPDVLYTVEIHTRRQGKEPWKNVAGCVNISFSYCNLSSSFADIYQLHFTRLRAVWAGGGSHWTGSHREFFPLRDTSFSSPRLSLSVRGQSVTVKVHLPCSPYRSRRSQCKLVSKVTPRLHISVTVYREDLPSHSQVETLISHGKNPNHVFTGLVAGHRYCAVANLSSIYSHSPLSPPRCFSVPEHVPALSAVGRRSAHTFPIQEDTPAQDTGSPERGHVKGAVCAEHGG